MYGYIYFVSLFIINLNKIQYACFLPTGFTHSYYKLN